MSFLGRLLYLTIPCNSKKRDRVLDVNSAVDMNNRGFSVLEVLVSVGISIIAMMAMTSLLMANQKESARLYEKMTLLDVGNQIRNALLSSDKCTANLSLSANFTAGNNNFNSAAIPLTGTALATPLLSPRSIFMGTTIGSPVVIQKNTKVGNTSITIQDISIVNWLKSGSDDFTADLIVGVVSDKGPLAPLKIAGLNISTDPASPVGNKKILACALGSSGSAGAGAITQVFTLVGPGGVNNRNLALGEWVFCALSGQESTADDSNMYDHCEVAKGIGKNWTLLLTKHKDDTLTCKATCLNF